jgi:hypothetical protein
MHSVSDVRPIGVHTAEPLVPDPSRLELKLLLQSSKSTNRLIVIKFRQNLFNQETSNSLILILYCSILLHCIVQ